MSYDFVHILKLLIPMVLNLLQWKIDSILGDINLFFSPVHTFLWGVNEWKNIEKQFGIIYWVSISVLVSDGSTQGGERRRSTSIYATSNNSKHTREPGNVKFTLDEIYKATKNFSPSLKIGQGGFGTVYKGRLEDGTLVAVKRAKKVCVHSIINLLYTSCGANDKNISPFTHFFIYIILKVTSFLKHFVIFEQNWCDYSTSS